ncbi:hypothetical protein BSKO_00564 [Bryopsis sp. KO-2023]|nr:hypothetical protein BSKO_00564 [Bryopsis sp. KO-2023]
MSVDDGRTHFGHKLEVELMGNSSSVPGSGATPSSRTTLFSPPETMTSPLHKRKRTLSQQTSDCASLDDCVYSPLSDAVMSRDVESSSDPVDSRLGGFDLDMGRGLQSEFKLEGKWVTVRMEKGEISWQESGPRFPKCYDTRKTGWVMITDILAGVHVQPGDVCRCTSCCDQFHKLVIHTYTAKNGKTSEWVPFSYSFCSPDGDTVVKWASKINAVLSSNKERPRKLWVFVNPYGGHKQAKQIWQNKVYPTFRLAGIKCTVLFTTHSNHAFDVIKEATSQDIGKYDGLIAIGGDGFFQEILNGVLARSNKPWSDNEAVHRSLRLGHIPAGSMDAVAWSLHGTRSVMSATLRIVFGDRLPLDVMRIETGSGGSRYSACLAGYGFMGDISRASERLRWMGPLRYDIAGVMVFLLSRSHRARIIYNPAGPPPPVSQNVCVGPCSWCKGNEEAAPREEGPIVCRPAASAINSTSPISSPFKTLEGDFISIIATVTPCRSDKSQHGITPYAHLGDGRMHLVLVRKTSRLNYLKWLHSLTKTGVQPGKFKFVETIDATAVCVEPVHGKSAWNVDGEVLGEQTLSAVVHRGLVDVFSRGIQG